MPIIFGILLTVILFEIYPQLLALVIVAFTCYIFCKAMHRKTIGQAILFICIILALNMIIEKAKPMIDKTHESKQFIESIDGDKDKEKIKPTKKIWDFLNKYPNERR